MKLYTSPSRNTAEVQASSLQKIFETHFRESHEGMSIIVDSQFEKRVIVQKHTNPENSQLEERYCTILKKDLEHFHQGSYFRNTEIDNVHSMEYDIDYLVLSEPKTTDGIACKCKVRKTTDDCTFSIKGKQYTYRCICTNKMLYDNGQYTEESKVFEEDEMRAIVLPYDTITQQLDVIDDFIIDEKLYKVVKIDTVLDEARKFGVLQVVLLRTSFGEISLYNSEMEREAEIKGILRFVQMKDKVLNSKARELITKHHTVKSGDYIKHTYQRDKNNPLDKETRWYIVRSLIDMRLEYDATYVLNCDSEFYLWDSEKKERVMIPCYVEDNRTVLQNYDRGNYVLLDASTYQILVQRNKYTLKLHNGVNRIIMNGRAFEITGVDDISLGNAIYVGLKVDKVNSATDNIELGIADYDKQLESNNEDIKVETTNLCIIGEEEVYLGEISAFEVTTPLDNGKWTLESEDIKVENAIQIISETNSKIELKVNMSNKYLYKHFTLKYSNGSAETIKKIIIESW